jgi:hypothetical protein
MRTVHRSLAVVFATVLLLVATQARADRASCDVLLAARDTGQRDEQIAETYQTTHARIVACARISDHRQRLQAARDATETQRVERAAARSN